MILSTGWRTDIPAFYSEWFYNRVKAGYLLEQSIANPTLYNKVSLSPKNVEILTFCSKDYKKFIPKIDIVEKKYRCFYWYTITPYEDDVELYVPSLDERINTFIELSKIVGKKRIVWRYDPILFTDKYTKEYHFEKFRYIAEKLAPYTERCVFSFVHAYAKTMANMPELVEPIDTTKVEMCRYMLNVCNEVGLKLQTCGMGAKWNLPGILKSACLNAPMLEEAFNIRLLPMLSPGQRDGCGCLPQKVIGNYLTCLHGCRYCYATKSYDEALINSRYHNPKSPLFIGELPEEYTIEDFKMAKVIDYTYDPNQLTMFEDA